MKARSAIKSNMRAKCITTSTAVKLAFFYSHLYCTSKKKKLRHHKLFWSIVNYSSQFWTFSVLIISWGYLALISDPYWFAPIIAFAVVSSTSFQKFIVIHSLNLLSSLGSHQLHAPLFEKRAPTIWLIKRHFSFAPKAAAATALPKFWGTSLLL